MGDLLSWIESKKLAGQSPPFRYPPESLTRGQ